jgi:DNA-binding MarR family transcriptional regulator
MAGARTARTDSEQLQATAPWRLVLVDHAIATRQAALDGDFALAARPFLDAASRAILEQSLGSLAPDAIWMIEAFAAGSGIVAKGGCAIADAQAHGSTGSQDMNVRFRKHLEIILNALEADPSQTPAPATRAPTIIQSDLWQLLYKVRESAELAYARELQLIELDRRILFLLYNVGPLVPADVATAVGVDKAQVSRSIKRLLDIGMIERGQLRAPLILTAQGHAVTMRLMKLADLRNRELTFDVGDEELEAFFAAIEKLLDQSVLLYEQERRLGRVAETAQFPRPGAAIESESVSGERIVLDRTRIIFPLMTLSSYFSRSGSLAFKRLTGLSSFEAWVLNEIGMGSPIEWNSLVERLDRDHSQAGRTINALVDRGLVQRDGKPGRRNGRFQPTDEGMRLYEVIQEAGRQRSAFLMSTLSDAERDRFLATFDKLKRNAVVQLERERAFRELA